ncbi:HlyD family secretion protein [Candidatus Protochlamydia naegleriophila]|uniref:HlyD family secretion protein n=1 Tax=Candidatus Protochlamydia naegleriophila TaxID=389348 RepID=A0A0U5JAF1_9BACT|nr:efflux RND transporter periplasmic adaptor subunit [Candidatus Protochlamydia naegleriophila]CUI15748.1 HlyD family secretion protein [Candidatus Protochlamydia naegleriophila]
MKRLFFLLIFCLLIGGVIFLYRNYFQEKNKDPNLIILYGNVDVRQVDLGFRVKGRVESMPYQEGDYVPQGSLIATLDKQPYIDLVLQARAHVESVKASLKNADLLLGRRRTLVGTGAISSEEYDDAISSRDVLAANLKEAEASLGVALTNLHDTEIYAPNDGTILTRIREPGAVIREADPIYTLSLISPIWVRAFVAEPLLGAVYPGMRAEIFTDTKGSPVYQGHVGFISPVAEFTPKTVETTQLRTDLVYRLRIIADNPDQGLRQGMPVTVKLRRKPLETQASQESQASEEKP